MASELEIRKNGDLQIGKFKGAEVGLVITGNPSYEEWEECGKLIQRAGKAAMFWIGDWLWYGEKKYGDTYSQAIEDTGLDYDTLKAAKWVCGRIELVRRRTNLSFSHHREVASLEPKEQEHWLGEASQKGWSQKELRSAIRRSEDVDASDFPWFLYNIWNLKEGDGKDFFGAFPEVFMSNLLYYHTKEGDLVYDPFSGSGTTIDICKRMKRKWYCSDIKPTRGDIKKWDITMGLPDDLPVPDLVFLDPPYRAQAENKYTNETNEFGNMGYTKFMENIRNLVAEIKKRKFPQIALVVAPCYKNGKHGWEDYAFLFHELLFDKYAIDGRCNLPYSTQEYHASQVIKAKELKVYMSLIRDLVIWKLK